MTAATSSRERRSTPTRPVLAMPIAVLIGLSWPSLDLRMFDSLSEKLQGALDGVRQRGALTDEDIAKAMREIRLALLEADVNFKVVKQFTAAVKERATGAEVAKSLN